MFLIFFFFLRSYLVFVFAFKYRSFQKNVFMSEAFNYLNNRDIHACKQAPNLLYVKSFRRRFLD